MSQAALEAGLARIRLRFLDLLRDRLEVLEDSLDGTPSKPEALENAIFVVHKVAGSAGSLGMGDLSEAARSCENVLTHDKAQAGAITRDGAQSIVNFHAYASAVLAQSSVGATA